MAELSHEDFARYVLVAAMPPARVAEVIKVIVGDSIDIGPLRVGPGGVGYATAVGNPGVVQAELCDDENWDVRVAVPVHLHVRVGLAGRTLRYQIDVMVGTRIRLLLEKPCAVVVDIETVRRENVATVVNPRGIPSRLVGMIGNINHTVADHVLAYINDLVKSPTVQEICRIDVPDMLNRAWDAGLVVDVPDKVAAPPALTITQRAG